MQSYQCVYRASHEKGDTVLLYSYEKPGKIRMDIEKPKKGAVLIYNPAQSNKVRVRPFPATPFINFNFNLNDDKVKSKSGGTVDRSDLGSRLESFCAELSSAGKNAQVVYYDGGRPQGVVISGGPKDRVKVFSFGEDGLLKRIEVTESGKKAQTSEWSDLKLNPKFKPDFFEKF